MDEIDRLLDVACNDVIEHLGRTVFVNGIPLKCTIDDEQFEDESGYLSNIYAWCPAGTKCAPPKQKTTTLPPSTTTVKFQKKIISKSNLFLIKLKMKFFFDLVIFIYELK